MRNALLNSVAVLLLAVSSTLVAQIPPIQRKCCAYEPTLTPGASTIISRYLNGVPGKEPTTPQSDNVCVALNTDDPDNYDINYSVGLYSVITREDGQVTLEFELDTLLKTPSYAKFNLPDLRSVVEQGFVHRNENGDFQPCLWPSKNGCSAIHRANAEVEGEAKYVVEIALEATERPNLVEASDAEARGWAGSEVSYKGIGGSGADSVTSMVEFTRDGQIQWTISPSIAIGTGGVEAGNQVSAALPPGKARGLSSPGNPEPQYASVSSIGDIGSKCSVQAENRVGGRIWVHNYQVKIVASIRREAWTSDMLDDCHDYHPNNRP